LPTAPRCKHMPNRAGPSRPGPNSRHLTSTGGQTPVFSRLHRALRRRGEFSGKTLTHSRERCAPNEERAVEPMASSRKHDLGSRVKRCANSVAVAHSIAGRSRSANQGAPGNRPAICREECFARPGKGTASSLGNRHKSAVKNSFLERIRVLRPLGCKAPSPRKPAIPEPMRSGRRGAARCHSGGSATARGVPSKVVRHVAARIFQPAPPPAGTRRSHRPGLRLRELSAEHPCAGRQQAQTHADQPPLGCRRYVGRPASARTGLYRYSHFGFVAPGERFEFVSRSHDTDPAILAVVVIGAEATVAEGNADVSRYTLVSFIGGFLSSE